MRYRAMALVVLVLLPLGLGAVAVTSDGPVHADPTFASLQPPTLPFVPTQGFLNATWFCAGVPISEGGAGGDVVVVNPGETPMKGSYTVFSDTKGVAAVTGTFAVEPRSTWTLAVEGATTGTDYLSAMVEITGGGGVVEQRADHEQGSAVSPCSNSTSSTWYFADNYTLNDSENSLVITNPYPDDAIIDVLAVNPQGSYSAQNLQGIAVRGQSVLVIAQRLMPKEESVLAFSVVARRGRVVVARSQRYRGERLGFTNTLGAPSTSTDWYFADGEKSDDVRFERYTIYNPNDRDVTVAAVALGVPSDDPNFINLREDTIGPGGVVSFTTAEWDGLPTGRHHMAFSSESDLGVVVERAITRTAGDGYVTTVCFGAPTPFSQYYRWTMGIGTDLAVDGVLIVANLGLYDGTVTVKALGPGGEAAIPGLEAVALPANGVLSIAIPQLEAALGVPLVVEADQPIVVERELPRGADLRGRSASLALPG
ncbi:MAG: hypothetical protein H6513_13500 [Acidimicrobiaceae bacterium]|nr:hypothetical protein [Ilumatobacter sp.]MCB9381697.1 hypothetical protein [Acidimicrobiaceae bacterium]MCO5329717.1 hypothetical protein [Ilumatobacteraceae bacterium]